MSILSRIFGHPEKLRGRQELLLDLDSSSVRMKRVFLLSDELRSNTTRVERTRKLTLDNSRPHMGLKGSLGLFASETWWSNINRGKMPLRFIRGTAVRVYAAGQDSEGVNNTVAVRTSDSTVETVGIYVNEPGDVDLFKVGHLIMIVYAQDELKDGSQNLGVPYSEVALEMAVSLEPIS